MVQASDSTFGILSVSLLLFVLLFMAPYSEGDAQAPASTSEAHSGGSLLVQTHRAVLKQGPSSRFKLRGMAVKDARLPVLESARGEGCNAGVWYRVNTDAWICADEVTLVRDNPVAIAQPSMKDRTLTPWPYAFISENATEYEWSRYGWLEERREIFPGFGFGVEKRISIDGVQYYKTPEGRIIPATAARISGRVSTFRGVQIHKGDPWPVGWVNAREAWAYTEPSAAKEFRVRKLERYERFNVQEEALGGKQRFYRLGEGEWVRDRDVRVATRAPRPKDVRDDERWIDVDVKSQIVTAYVGDTPVYATLVSTGRYGGSRTVKGQFRVWVKVAAIAMDNTDEVREMDSDTAPLDTDTGDTDSAERKLYSLQDVPWTQFFHESYAIHAVYWHDRFGNRKSHGCVNMAPTDALWFYNWTSPAVPDGWWSVYATETDRGTVIRVR